MSAQAGCEPAQFKSPVAGARASTRFVLDALFVKSTAERYEALRASADAVNDWDGVLENAERHGVLGLLAHHVRTAGIDLPEAVAHALEGRAEALREDARRFEFTLDRFLRAAADEGCKPTLLKGASLAHDLYADPSWRGQGDIDLLVEPDQLDAAIAAGRKAGVVADTDALPNWWYRRAHFHSKLSPTSALLREVEVHWALQHPSLLLTPDARALLERRIERRVRGASAFDLDPVDRFLHLTTHLVSHARGIPGRADLATLACVAEDERHPLRLKWIVDVRGELERFGADLPVDELVEHALQWGCVAELHWLLEWVRSALGLLAEADAATLTLLRRLEGLPNFRPANTVGVRHQDAGPMDGFDFRADALARLPRWFWPPSEFIERRYGPGAWRVWCRVRHMLDVAGRVLGAAALLPIALVGRRRLATRRREVLDAALEPDAVLELAVAWRRFGSAA